MNAKRAVAAVIAILLVVGAFLIRRNVIDDDEVESDDSVVTSLDTEPATALVCITELRAVCASLQQSQPDLAVTVEDAGVTLARLAALEELADAPLWLTIEPFPAMVDALRSGRRADPLGAESVPLGASQLAIAFPNDGRLDTLRTDCGSTPIWRCIGDHAGAPWTELGGRAGWATLRPSFGDVSSAALGLASLAGAVAGYLGDASVSRNRWEADATFIPWFRRLADASEGVALSGGSPVRTMVTRPSALDAGATATFELAGLGATGERLTLTYPEPQMWVQAVLATPPDVAAPDGLAADTTALLGAQGWDPPDAAGPPVPNAPTMLALSALWDEAT